MKLEIIFQFTNETFHTQLQIRGNFKVCDCRNGTPRRAVVNRLGVRGQSERECSAILHCMLASSVAIVICNVLRKRLCPSASLSPDNCAAAAVAACVFLGIFRHFWLLSFGEANSRRKLQTKVNAKAETELQFHQGSC